LEIARGLEAAKSILRRAVITLLPMEGIVDQQMLIENRSSAIFIIFLAAAIFTPGPTPFLMLVLAIPLTLLYDVSVWLPENLVGRKDQQNKVYHKLRLFFVFLIRKYL